MGEPESETSSCAQRRRVERLSEEEVGRVVARSGWTEQEAEAVLLEQKSSGRSVADFAAEHGFSRSRLYYWKKRLAAVASQAPPEPEPALQPMPRTPRKTAKEERELAPEELERVLVRELCAEAVGDQQVQQYVLRAVRDNDKMWSVFEVRARGSVLLCVVRWAGADDARPYSVVGVERTALALTWRDYATRQEASDAMAKQAESRCAGTWKDAVPLLMPVQIRDAAPGPALATKRESPDRDSEPFVTVDLPWGARIRIPNAAAPTLARTVLRTIVRGPS